MVTSPLPVCGRRISPYQLTFSKTEDLDERLGTQQAIKADMALQPNEIFLTFLVAKQKIRTEQFKFFMGME